MWGIKVPFFSVAVVKIPIFLRVDVSRASRPGHMWPMLVFSGSRYVILFRLARWGRLSLAGRDDVLRLFFSGVHSSSDSEVSGDVFGSEWSLSGSESIVVVEGLGWYACSVWECVLVISGRMSSEPGARVRM